MGRRTGKLLPISSLLGHHFGVDKKGLFPRSSPELNNCGSVFNLAAGWSCAGAISQDCFFMPVFNSKTCPSNHGMGDFAVLCMGEIWFPLCPLWSQEYFVNELGHWFWEM